MNRTFALIFLNIALLSLTACPSGHNTTPSRQEIIPIKGDPMVFIKGAQMDSTSGIPAELFSEGQEWTMGIRGFTEAPQATPKASQDEIESANAPPKIDSEASFENSIKKFQIEKFDALLGETVLLEESSNDNNNPISFKLRKRSDKYLLTSIHVGPNQEAELSEVVVQHYSVKEDQNAFSFLISFNNGGAKALYSFEFIKVKDKSFFQTKLNEMYFYIYGPGVKVAWNQTKPPKISICDPNRANIYQENAKEAALVWRNQVLENRLNYSVSEGLERCPPFSDLNVHSIVHIKDWVEVYKEQAMLAFTVTTADFYDEEFVDGDIFFLESEWDELLPSNLTLSDEKVYGQGYYLDLYKITITHEMGHLLGLHHQFDDKIPSMMGYDDVAVLTTYDINAIEELYPSLVVEEEGDELAGPQ